MRCGSRRAAAVRHRADNIFIRIIIIIRELYYIEKPVQTRRSAPRVHARAREHTLFATRGACYYSNILAHNSRVHT